MTAQPVRTLAPPFDKWLDRPEPLAAHAEISGRLAARAERTLKEADAPERRAVSSEEIYTQDRSVCGWASTESC